MYLHVERNVRNLRKWCMKRGSIKSRNPVCWRRCHSFRPMTCARCCTRKVPKSCRNLERFSLRSLVAEKSRCPKSLGVISEASLCTRSPRSILSICSPHSRQSSSTGQPCWKSPWNAQQCEQNCFVFFAFFVHGRILGRADLSCRILIAWATIWLWLIMPWASMDHEVLDWFSFLQLLCGDQFCQSKWIWILDDLRTKFGEEETKHLQQCAWLGKVKYGYNKKELWEMPHKDVMISCDFCMSSCTRLKNWTRQCFVMSCAVATKQPFCFATNLREMLKKDGPDLVEKDKLDIHGLVEKILGGFGVCSSSDWVRPKRLRRNLRKPLHMKLTWLLTNSQMKMLRHVINLPYQLFHSHLSWRTPHQMVVSSQM